MSNQVGIRIARFKQKRIELKGVITNKKELTRLRHPKYIYTSKGDSLAVTNNLYNEFKVGDLLIKEKGSTKYMIVKENDTMSFYPVISKHILYENKNVLESMDN